MIADISSRREEPQDLCRRFHVRRLDLFGSATGDDFDRARSDLDFLVEFDRGAPGPCRSRPFSALKRRLRRCSGRSVDLVEPSAILNPYLKQSVDRSRESVFEA